MSNSSAPFREFVKYSLGRYHFRLGHTVYSTDMQITAVYVERESGSYKLSSEELRAKAWIARNLKAGLFEKRKEAAVMFSNPCFQRPRYSSSERIEYTNAKYNRGSNEWL